jgi:hypothetical protein
VRILSSASNSGQDAIQCLLSSDASQRASLEPCARANRLAARYSNGRHICLRMRTTLGWRRLSRSARFSSADASETTAERVFKRSRCLLALKERPKGLSSTRMRSGRRELRSVVVRLNPSGSPCSTPTRTSRFKAFDDSSSDDGSWKPLEPHRDRRTVFAECTGSSDPLLPQVR